MMNTKKYLVVVLMCVVVLGISACGNRHDGAYQVDLESTSIDFLSDFSGTAEEEQLEHLKLVGALAITNMLPNTKIIIDGKTITRELPGMNMALIPADEKKEMQELFTDHIKIVKKNSQMQEWRVTTQRIQETYELSVVVTETTEGLKLRYDLRGKSQSEIDFINVYLKKG
jgi:hypothetical protein